MTTSVAHRYYQRDLLTAAQAAAESAPQLAAEIRGHMRHLAARFSAGAPMGADDLDVRTLVALIGQTTVQVPPVRVSSG